MGLIKNAINFGNGFNIGAVAPIDSRMRVKSVEDLTSVWTAEIPAYKGMIVSVMDTSEVYVLKDADNYTSIDSWVKLGSASGTADALKDAKAYTDQEVKKLTDGAVKTNTTAIAKLNGDVNTVGSVAKAVADAVAAEKSRAEGKEGELKTAIDNEKTARENAINALDANVDSTGGSHVTVHVTEADGVITSVTVAESDIASASSLTAEANTRKADDDAIIAKIGTVGTGTTVVGMISAEADRAVAAEASLQAQIGQAATGESVATGLHKEIADVKDAYEKAINALDATVGGTAIAEGNHVAVQVVEENGKLKSLTVTENDIASASALTAEIGRATSAENALDSRLDTIEGSGEGSISKAVADVKKELLGDAAPNYNTLGKLEDKIIKVSGDAKTYSIAKVEGDELTSLGANVKEAYKLVENGNAKAGEYIKVYKDSALQSVALVGQELQFTYILDSGQTSTVSVDVSNFLAESEFANGLQVVDHVVSVKRNETSEDFLTVSKDGIKLSGVQSAIDTAKKAVTDRLDKIEGSGEGSIKKALADAKDYASGYTDTKIASLNADVTSEEGTKVRVQVVETAGKITDVTVTDVDIASASALTAEIGRATSAETALDSRLDTIEGSGEGSVAKALVDAKAYTDTKITEEETARTNAVETAKSDLIGKATGDYNTLGKLEGKIKDAEAAAKAAATKLNKASDASHLTLNSVSGTSGEITYTIGESDIASANELDALKDAVGTGFTSASTVANHIAVLEGVTVTGKNAIVVSASSATENKEVSLKLGAQPAEGVAGVVLSQDANGLVAKLYWGTF